MDSSTFKSPRGGKENEVWSNPRKKIIVNGKKKISFPPPGESQSAQTCFGGAVEKVSKFETKNGHEWGAIWSYRAVNPPPESPGRDLARGKGPRVPGGWGVGKKLKNFHVWATFF